jgi:RNA polymerase sigma-70 factor (ECF subfamily)
MSDGESLCALFGRVRAGDQQAATELVRRYEPALRRTIRLRLRDQRLRRLLDSTDVCQAVLLRFWVRVSTGGCACSTPEQVLKLLAVMARNHLINLALQQQAGKRDCRRITAVPAEEWALTARGSSPSQHVAARELLTKARLLLAPDERRLLELRQEGQEWAAIARMVGGSPEALRKHLARALARMTHDLGLEGAPHD